MQYRHGDVFLKGINSIPKEAKAVKPEGDIILAYGEVTGHAHRVQGSGVELLEVNGTRYLRVLAEAEAYLNHEDHGRIDLAPGFYEVVQQVEWTLEGETRNVTD